MPDLRRFSTVAILAGAYKVGNVHAARTHVYDAMTGATLCKRIKPESLCDESATSPDDPATCGVCAKRDPRGDDSDGLYILRSMIQIG